MTAKPNKNAMYRIYENRIGEPDTVDEVRGYWMFLVGMLIGVVGVLIFLPSESAVNASGFTLREGSIVLMALGLVLLLAGPIIRLPLAKWVTYATYLGQLLSLAAIIWFMVVFPDDWNVLTGNQPVILLYLIGLGVIMVGGIAGPLITGRTQARLDSSERDVAELEAEKADVESERHELEEDLEESQRETEAGEAARVGLEADRAELREEVEALEAQLDALRSSQAQYEIFEDETGGFRWRLRHRNGNVIADSNQSYSRKHDAKRGMASVRRNALGATMLEIVPEPDEEPETVLEETPIIPAVAEESRTEFEVYQGEGDDWRWRLVHDNGNILADSGEGYTSKQSVKRGIESVKQNAGPATYLQFDPMSFQIYQDTAGEWRWRLLHKNGNILAAATAGYTRRRDANRSVESIRKTVGDAEDQFEIYEDNRGNYRWRFRATNNEIIATSGQGYHSREEATSAVERIQEFAPDADALDIGFAAFEVYTDEGEEWRWRLRHRNGNIIADGSQGHSRRVAIHNAIESIKRNVPEAEVREA